MNKILNEISSRFSPMAFSTVKPTEESLKRMLEAARWAPSAYNEQPWQFILAVKGSKEYQKIRESLMEYNQVWTDSAPVLGVVLANELLAQNNKQNWHFMYDSGAAMSAFTLQAVAEGYQIHQMGGFDHKMLEESFSLHKNVKSIAAFALGVPGDVSHLPQDMQDRANAERERKPQEEMSKIYMV